MGHHDHHGTSHVGHTEPTPQGELVKVFSEANSHYVLTAKGDIVVLSKSSDHNPDQQWYRDDSHGSKVKDEGGHSAFALINKGSRLALKHISGHHEDTVALAPYHENDSSFLWTQSEDVGGGYKTIRPVSNTKLNLDAEHATKENGGVKDNNRLILYKWNKGENQKWKITSICEFLPMPVAVEDLIHSFVEWQN